MLGEVLESRYVRAIEENASTLGLSLSHLMECAGKCVADLAAQLLGEPREEKLVVVVTGRGGNAGDGFVAARHLASRGYRVRVLALYGREEIEHPDARTNFALLSAAGVEIQYFREHGPAGLEGASLIIDAILGTGVRPPLRSPIREAIEAINASKARKIAIDIPSGLDPDCGYIGDVAVFADYTVAIHYRKPVHVLERSRVGEVVVCNVGIPRAAEEYVGPGHVRHLVLRKPKDAKKGDGGRVLVLGGSVEYVGAPALAAMAALRTGADLVFVGVPEIVRPVVASFSPNIITFSVGRDYLSPDHLDKVMEFVKKSDSIVLGPGMSLNRETEEFVTVFLEKAWKASGAPPLVVDADALKVAARLRPKLGWRAVLTPHRGELRVLSEGYGLPSDLPQERTVIELSTRSESVVLLKAPVDVICKGEKCMRNSTGTPAMSTGGTGDVLSGIVAALVKRTRDIFEAAFIAAYVNGRAGEMATRRLGEGISATDLLDSIPVALYLGG
ncbi:MAG: NAD(P)H-hydrate dehydratase [Fervidicoccaceae archaeon]